MTLTCWIVVMSTIPRLILNLYQDDLVISFLQQGTWDVLGTLRTNPWPVPTQVEAIDESKAFIPPSHIKICIWQMTHLAQFQGLIYTKEAPAKS